MSDEQGHVDGSGFNAIKISGRKHYLVATWTFAQMLLEIAFAAVVVVLFASLVYSGLLARVEIRANDGPLKDEGNAIEILYKYHRKSYWRVCTAASELATLIGGDKSTIGIYYDDPRVVKPSECRWIYGAIVRGGWAMNLWHMTLQSAPHPNRASASAEIT